MPREERSKEAERERLNYHPVHIDPKCPAQTPQVIASMLPYADAFPPVRRLYKANKF